MAGSMRTSMMLIRHNITTRRHVERATTSTILVQTMGNTVTETRLCVHVADIGCTCISHPSPYPHVYHPLVSFSPCLI